MAIYISNFSVDHFRGIHDLSIDNINHINIIAGDNNCGKTSILEAILLLRNPADITNVLRIARLRDASASLGGVSIYENFINLFPKDGNKATISLRSLCRDDDVRYLLTGEQKKIMLEPEDLSKKISFSQRRRIMQEYGSGPVETDAFVGEAQYELGVLKGHIKVDINAYTSVSGKEIIKENYLDMIYLSPFNHVQGNVFGRIIRNDSYKDICLHILRLFDPDIVDLLILRNEDNNRPVEYVKHKTFGNMPLSTYGDGIKKVLSIANGIAQASGGILMIDEVETAIHSKYYNDIFRFIIKACLQFNVQAFITTHSLEAIDGFLEAQDYSHQSDYDNISVITLKKELKKTYSRVLPGRKAYANREHFGFEVRL